MLILKNANVLSIRRKEFIGDVAVENGRIYSVGKDISIPGAKEIDLTGCYVMPGIIDAHSHIGMWEDGMGREGADGNEATNATTRSAS